MPWTDVLAAESLTSGAIYSNWVTTSLTTTASNLSTWSTWTGGNSTTYSNGGTLNGEIRYDVHCCPQPTDEELEQRRVAREQRRIAAEERAAVEAAAGVRAEETLQVVLDPDQWADWEREKQFRLITQSGREYQIRRGIAGNIRLVEDDAVAEVLCCHPNRSVRDDNGEHLGIMPVEDVVLAQVLALRTDEEGFRRTANISRISRAQREQVAVAS